VTLVATDEMDDDLEELHNYFSKDREKRRSASVLDAPRNLEALDLLCPPLMPTFDVAAYANKSRTVQRLAALGVQVHKFNRDYRKLRLVLGKDFEEDIQPCVAFLESVGLDSAQVSSFLTHNPLVLGEPLETLDTRVQYLRDKKFSPQAVVDILTAFPQWLSYSIKEVDTNLGFFHKEFLLTGDQTRTLATNLPRFVFYERIKIYKKYHLLGDEFSLSKEQRSELLVNYPAVFMIGEENLQMKFRLFDKMGLSPAAIVANAPMVLTSLHNLALRHYFLKSLGRAVYDPREPGYVSPTLLGLETDQVFASRLARSSLHRYYVWQRQ